MQSSLERFINAQEHDYQTALAEMRAGYKCTNITTANWMEEL